MGIRPSALPGHATELSDAINEALTKKWGELRGLEVISIAMNPITLKEEDAELIKQAQRNAIMRDPNMAAASLVGAQAGGTNLQGLFQMGQQQVRADSWTCKCGKTLNRDENAAINIMNVGLNMV